MRSLHYFLPLIEELLAQPVPKSYVDYLRSKGTSRTRSSDKAQASC